MQYIFQFVKTFCNKVTIFCISDNSDHLRMCNITHDDKIFLTRCDLLYALDLRTCHIDRLDAARFKTFNHGTRNTVRSDENYPVRICLLRIVDNANAFLSQILIQIRIMNDRTESIYFSPRTDPFFFFDPVIERGDRAIDAETKTESFGRDYFKAHKRLP